MDRRYRLAIVVSHPIQHFVSLYRSLATHPNIELRVFFASRIGVERYFDDEMLTEIQWEMDLLSGYPHTFLAGAEAVDKITFWSINSPDLDQALADFRPDAIIVYGYTQRNSWRAMAWAKRNGRRVFMISDSELLQKRSRLLSLPKELLVRAAYRLSDAFLSVGDRNEEYYRRYGVPQKRIFRSPFTIDERRFRQAAAERDAARTSLRRQLGLREDAIIALFVGKLSPRKRPQDLLEAVRVVQTRRRATVHAVFAGSGALLKELGARAVATRAPAHFLGFCNLNTLPALYAAADFLVHTSEADPHPLVCSEAACVGLPVILSDRIGAEGSTDIARNGENCLIYPVGNVEALAALIEQLACDDSLRNRMSRRALQVYSELDLDRSVRGVLDALEAS